MNRTLLLTSWYFPHKVIRWEDAVRLIYLGKADVVAAYSEEIRSPSTSMGKPAVIRIRKQLGKLKQRVRFSRINVFTRDDFRCQYCDQRLALAKLTFDHVIPRSCGGRTEWTNIVTSCRPCNAKKRDRTPDEAGMFPRNSPRQPRTLPLTPPRIDPSSAPAEWRDFLPNLA